MASAIAALISATTAVRATASTAAHRATLRLLKPDDLIMQADEHSLEVEPFFGKKSGRRSNLLVVDASSALRRSTAVLLVSLSFSSAFFIYNFCHRHCLGPHYKCSDWGYMVTAIRPPSCRRRRCDEGKNDPPRFWDGAGSPREGCAAREAGGRDYHER